MNNKLQPALIAGGVSAVLGIILGLISTLTQTPGEQPSPALSAGLGCVTCLMIIGTGALAVYLYVQRSTTPARAGDGAVLGLITGLVSAIINLFVGTPLSYFINRENLEQQMEPMRQAMGYTGSTLTLLLLFGALGLITTPLFTMLGGLLGVPLFEKRKADARMPPPPQGYGGTPDGSSGTSSGTTNFER